MSTPLRIFSIAVIFICFSLGFSLPVYGQTFGLKPTFAYNFHSVNGVTANTFGGGINFENSMYGDGNKSSLHFSALYFGGKGALTENDFDKWFSDEQVQNPERVAESSNFDMVYGGFGQRFYLGDTQDQPDMNGLNIGYSVGWGIPIQDNPFGYYWDLSLALGYQYFFKENRSIDWFAKIGYGSWTYDAEYFRAVYNYDTTYVGIQFKSASMFFIQTGVSVGLFK